MLFTKLTEEQLDYIKNIDSCKDTSIFPNNNIKIEKRDKRRYLIVDLQKAYNFSNCSRLDFIDIVEQYEKLGWKYFAVCSPYLYLYKENNILTKICNIFKK